MIIIFTAKPIFIFTWLIILQYYKGTGSKARERPPLTKRVSLLQVQELLEQKYYEVRAF